jgi:CRP/FNR family cyclic AMP-dependent transcriptional regulator
MSSSETVQVLKKCPLMATVSGAALLTIAQETEERTYRRRQIVYFSEQKNDYIFFLVSGRVKLLRTAPNEREVTLDIVSPNQLFGEANIFVPNSAYGSSAEVLEDSVVYAMRRTSLIGAMSMNMDSLRAFSSLQVERRHAAEQRLAEFVFYDVPTRVAHLLGQLASFYSRPGMTEGVLIKAKLTHQELANLVGSTRETTTLILNDFRRKGLISFLGRKIIALDVDGLNNFDSTTLTRQPRVERVVRDDDDDDDEDSDGEPFVAPVRRGRGRPRLNAR